MAACASTGLYYSGIDATTLGANGLKAALHDLVDDHAVVSYSEAWDALAVLDRAPSDGTMVQMIYSDHLHDAASARGITTGWTREHAWPRSYGIGSSGPDYSDLHALFPCDWNVNAARSNRFFDECTSSQCASPAHAEASATTAKDTQRFQPPASVRGDLARARR